MRSLFLIVSALVESHAQLMPLAPWPMQGRNSLHSANGLSSRPDNGVIVATIQSSLTDWSPFSEISIGADSTIYVGTTDRASSDDECGGYRYDHYSENDLHEYNEPRNYTCNYYLSAINPADYSTKWKYRTPSPIFQTPAIGIDGTVYFGAFGRLSQGFDYDGSGCRDVYGSRYSRCSILFVYALNSADGSLKWKFTDERLRNQGSQDRLPSSPTIGPDGTVYVIHRRALFAFNPVDGSVKWKASPGGRYGDYLVNLDAPAVGIDGAVYIILQSSGGSHRKKIMAYNADGIFKWEISRAAGGGFHAGPLAVGPDGTVYQNRASGLCALNPADGSLKWRVSSTGSMPAFGADGTVYVGVSGHLSALNPADGRLKWMHKVGPGVERIGPPLIDPDGTAYVNVDGTTYLYAINADGSLKWKYDTPAVFTIISQTSTYHKTGLSSKAVMGADGTLYLATRGLVYGFGLSTGYVTSLLHLAQRALSDLAHPFIALQRNECLGQTLNSLPPCNGLPQLQRLCDFSKAVHNQGETAGTFTPDTVALIDLSCQILRNQRNSPSYGDTWKRTVDPLSFTAYQGLISTDGTMMTLLRAYEADLAKFNAVGSTIDARIADVRDAAEGYAADAANWQARSQRDTAAMNAYGTEIVTLGKQMDSKYAVVQESVLLLIQDLTRSLTQLAEDLKNAWDEAEAKKVWSVWSLIWKTVKTAVVVTACLLGTTASGGLALAACGPITVNAVEENVAAFTAANEALWYDCDKCKELTAEIQEAKDAQQEIDALVVMSEAARDLNAQLSTGKSLPNELPLLIDDKIAMDTLRSDAKGFIVALATAGLVQGHNSSDISRYQSDVHDWVDMGVTRVSLFLSYYNIATRVQNDAGELKALQARSSIVTDRLKDEQNKEAAAMSGYFLMYERQQKQAMLVTKYLYDEFKQYQYFSLSTLPPIALPDNPQSRDFLKVQQALEQDYQVEIVNHKFRNIAWIHIEVNRIAEPLTLLKMSRTGSVSVVLPIPDATDTTYNQMRLHNARVYLLDAAGSTLGNGPSVEVSLSKPAGTASFFDSRMKKYEFTHGPVKLGGGAFVYNPETGCPLSNGYCGDLCPNYVHYSPFGTWNVQIFSPEQQKVDLKKLASIRFEFQVDYSQSPGYSANFFGKASPRYTQDFGALCPNASPRFDDFQGFELFQTKSGNDVDQEAGESACLDIGGALDGYCLNTNTAPPTAGPAAAPAAAAEAPTAALAAARTTAAPAARAACAMDDAAAEDEVPAGEVLANNKAAAAADKVETGVAAAHTVPAEVTMVILEAQVKSLEQEVKLLSTEGQALAVTNAELKAQHRVAEKLLSHYMQGLRDGASLSSGQGMASQI